jgi:hypothetical protein
MIAQSYEAIAATHPLNKPRVREKRQVSPSGLRFVAGQSGRCLVWHDGRSLTAMVSSPMITGRLHRTLYRYLSHSESQRSYWAPNSMLKAAYIRPGRPRVDNCHDLARGDFICSARPWIAPVHDHRTDSSLVRHIRGFLLWPSVVCSDQRR